MSDVFEKLNNFTSGNNISKDTLNNLFDMINNSTNSTQNNQENHYSKESTTSSNSSSSTDFTNSSNTNGIDFETILKMKNIIDKMNTKDDPRANLLKSLKPYLNDSRKSKIDQYIQLMNMSKVLDVFPLFGGDMQK